MEENVSFVELSLAQQEVLYIHPQSASPSS